MINFPISLISGHFIERLPKNVNTKLSIDIKFNARSYGDYNL